MPESDSHGAPTDTKGQGIEAPDTQKKPRKQSSGRKRLKDIEKAEEKVDRDLFNLDTC